LAVDIGYSSCVSGCLLSQIGGAAEPETRSAVALALSFTPAVATAPLHGTEPMSDTLPDRLATNPKSPFYNAAVLERGIGIRFNGEEKHNVEEYCVSEGWVRLPVGRSLDRHGNAMTIKAKGTVEPYFLDEPQAPITP